MKRLIAFEGLDGSGKATQVKCVSGVLEKRGVQLKRISFPDYESPSSALVKMYLSGELGTLDEVNVYAASSFYSLDRYASFAKGWKADYEAGKLIIADRYTPSNICHQMVKLPPAGWQSYIKWIEQFEYDMLGLPRPDKVIYFDMHPEASKKLIERRYSENGGKKDLHESNLEYLNACREAALFAARRLGWSIISCSCPERKPYPIEKITDEAVSVIEGLL